AIGVLCRCAGTEDRRVGFDVARQVCGRCADVTDLDQVLVKERALHADVPVLYLRRLRVDVEREQGRWRDEGVGRWIHAAGEGILEIQSRAAVLNELRRRDGADRYLRRGARSVLELIVEEAVAAANRPPAGAGGI